MSFRKSLRQLMGLHDGLEPVGTPLALLGLRIILAYEFGQAGLRKFRGENWFQQIQDSFPFPFNIVPADISWAIAASAEVLGAVLLVVGLATRYAALSLMILTAVATAAVHWPESYDSLGELWKGYAITNDGDGNYKLPLLYFLMFLPLLFSGGGRFSLDRLIRNQWFDASTPSGEYTAWMSAGMVGILLGLPLSFVLPIVGLLLMALGIALIVWRMMAAPRPA